MLNTHVLVSSTHYFSTEFSLNPYMMGEPLDRRKAQQEHQAIVAGFQRAGITVTQVVPPPRCQDGVYVANWALVHDGIAIMAHLPEIRSNEEPYARAVLTDLGLRCVEVPNALLFSGQGDSLICGSYLFGGQTYRSDASAQRFAAQTLGLDLVLLETVPFTADSHLRINIMTRRPESLFYDLDLALAVIDEHTIAYVPEAFTDQSRKALEALPIERIAVDFEEAVGDFACNLVSTGETVVMSSSAPRFRADLEKRGLSVIPVSATEIQKGGGFIRCISLTIS